MRWRAEFGGWCLAVALAASPSAAEEPAPEAEDSTFGEAIVVTATRTEQPASNLAGSITVLERAEIEASGVRNVDDLLRRTPGFILPRDTNAAGITTPQGSVAFRGLGGTSASRALVLVDGVPVNDPFGGWVVWTRIPVESTERVEVVRGGSVVWGNLAAAGLIHVITRRPEGRSFALTLMAGNADTRQGSAATSGLLGPAKLSLRATGYETDGVYRFPAHVRGPIDRRGPNQHHVFEGAGSLEDELGRSYDFKAGYAHDSRELGDGFTSETTRTAYASGGATGVLERGLWQLRVHGSETDFSARVAAVNASRTTATPATDQYDVPSSAAGAFGQWTRSSARHELSLGLDTHFVRGEAREDSQFMGGRFSRRRRSGGAQALAGLWVQDVMEVGPRWRLIGAARLDTWKASDGRRRERDLLASTPEIVTEYASNSATVLSPHLGVVFHPAAAWTLRAAAYGGFRAPTPNELYRPTRFVGGETIQESNAALIPERLREAETGVSYSGSAGRRVDLALFWAELDEAIFGVTIGRAGPGGAVIEPCGSLGAGGTCRQRQNVGLVRSRGLEAQLDTPIGRALTVYAHLALTDSKIVRAPRLPQLVGKVTRNAPEGMAGAGLRFSGARWSATVDGRWVGARYDDDLNQSRLGETLSLNTSFDASLRPGWSLIGAAENLLDRENPVARTALVEIGASRLVRVGVRWRTGAGR